MQHRRPGFLLHCVETSPALGGGRALRLRRHSLFAYVRRVRGLVPRAPHIRWHVRNHTALAARDVLHVAVLTRHRQQTARRSKLVEDLLLVTERVSGFFRILCPAAGPAGRRRRRGRHIASRHAARHLALRALLCVRLRRCAGVEALEGARADRVGFFRHFGVRIYGTVDRIVVRVQQLRCVLVCRVFELGVPQRQSGLRPLRRLHLARRMPALPQPGRFPGMRETTLDPPEAGPAAHASFAACRQRAGFHDAPGQGRPGCMLREHAPVQGHPVR